jgi:hypothetical protein
VGWHGLLPFEPTGSSLVTQSEMEETMAAGSVSWDTGEAIPGTTFRQMIKASDTGGRFSTQSAVLRPGESSLTHTETKTNSPSYSEGPLGAGRRPGRGG